MARALLLALLLSGPVTRAGADYLLDHHFCDAYYAGTGDCAALRGAVRANHTRALPTLELGDPSKPAMFLLHGWPDSAAVWANQFEYFCAPPHGAYFCVAPSWYDFHPDVPPAAAGDLWWDKQVDAFADVAAEMGLSNITFVIHDFGSILGYMFAYKYPGLLRKVVSLDIGNTPSPGGQPPRAPECDGVDCAAADTYEYQRHNIIAFLTNNDSMMQENIDVTLGATPPCAHCRVAPDATGFGAKTGWPYYQFVQNVWQKRFAPDVPASEWRFMWAPGFPDVPLLFLYGTCETGTGCTRPRPCPPCEPRTNFFFDPTFAWWVGNRTGSAVRAIADTGHWAQVRAAPATNAAIDAWL